MDIRLLKQDEFYNAKELWDYCFEKKGTPFFEWYFSSYCKAENILGAFDGEEFAAMVHLNSYTISLRGKAVQLSYLVGVATAPEKRGQGILPKMFKKAFSALREKGEYISLLMPIMAGIYLPYGFSFCYGKLKYDMPLKEIGDVFKNTEKYEYEFLSDKDISCLQKVYKKAMLWYSGHVIRSDDDWQAILADLSLSGGRIIAAKGSDGIIGYMLFFVKDGVFNVLELLAEQNDAKEALLYFAAQHLSQCDKFLWLAPEDDLTYLKFAGYDHCPVARPFMMGRVIDPERAVNELKLDMDEGQSVVIKLSDPLLAENNATFALKEIDGIAYMYKDDSLLPDVKMDIGVFAQICFGIYSIDTLRAAGSIYGGDEKTAILNKVFTQNINYINEYF